MVEVVINALIDFGIYSLLVLIYTAVGAYQNINIWLMKWDWKLWLNGLVKWLALGATLLGTIVSSFLLLAQAEAQGIEIVNAQAVAPKVILGVMLLASGFILTKIIKKLSTNLGLTEDDLKKLQEQAVNTDEGKPLVLELNDLPMPSDDYIKAKIQLEQEGGVGAHYSVPIDNYDVFRASVIGKGFDIDNFYGYQCWDGCALLWQQLGLNLYTGNGLAIGCWDLKRDANIYDQFDLITSVNELKRGDVVVMRPNHIGFFDGYDGNYMNILGQNQGGTPTNVNGGSGFNVVRIAKSAFAGAFRLKRWNVVVIEQPVQIQLKPLDEEIVNAVIRGDYGNGDERKLRLASAGYDPISVQKAVDIKLANKEASLPPVAPNNSNVVKYTYKSGDTFGQVVLNLGLNTNHGLWGSDGDVNYYTAQLHTQGIFGNIPVGTTITLVKRVD